MMLGITLDCIIAAITGDWGLWITPGAGIETAIPVSEQPFNHPTIAKQSPNTVITTAQIISAVHIKT